MCLIQPVKFREMETGFYNICSRFETGVVVTGFVVGSRHCLMQLYDMILESILDFLFLKNGTDDTTY